MRDLLLLVMAAGLVACQSVPDSQSWVQDGKSDQDGEAHAVDGHER